MRLPTTARRAFRPLCQMALFAAAVLAAPFLVDRGALDAALFHVISLAPVVACIVGLG
ncbi:MAG TPA: hypothetical protein VHX17_08135 [Candidatus Cybelea sp.]|nr:hypothetical protein [Candidatus Cybelea sp.]